MWIDPRGFKDPENARKLSGHWGYRPAIMKGLWDQTVSGDLKVMAKFLRDASNRPRDTHFIIRIAVDTTVRWDWHGSLQA